MQGVRRLIWNVACGIADNYRTTEKARFTLIELLGNWFRIGTERAWIATTDIITWSIGVLDYLLYLTIWAFESPPSSRSSYSTMRLLCFRIKKNKTRIFWTTLTKRVFLLVDDFMQKAFLSSLDPSSKYLTDVLVLDRALRWVGRVAMAIVAILAVWNSKIWNLLGSSVLIAKRRNNETTKRRNDETTKLAPNGWFVDKTIIQETFWSKNDRFFLVLFRSFVVSTFQWARHKKSQILLRKIMLRVASSI